MRLKEILNEEFPDITELPTTGTPDKAFRKLLRLKRDDVNGEDKEKVRQLGKGNFSVAAYSRDRPEDVVKISRAEQKEKVDGFLFFVKQLAKNEKMRDNIHFPRIRDVRVLKYSSGEVSYKVRMERLYQLDSLDDSELESLVNQTFKDDEAVDMFTGPLRRENEHLMYKLTEKDIIVLSLANVVSRLARLPTTVAPYIEDKELIEACNWLRKITLKKQYLYDLHSNNVVARRTSVGPQLVIADPFSFPPAPSKVL